MTEGFISVDGRWDSRQCDALTPGARLKVTIIGLEAVRTGDRLSGLFRIKPIVSLVNPGGFDARRHALSVGWVARASITDPERDVRPTLRAGAIGRVLEWPQPIRGLAMALLFGEKDQLDVRLKDLFEGLGLAHLLAISGLHVGLVLGGCWLVLKRSPWPAHPKHRVAFRALLMIGLAGLIAWWTLFSPSVVRAATMVGVLALSPLIGVRLQLSRVIAWTALMVSLTNPLATLSTGLLMSLGALLVIAMVGFAQPLAGWRALLAIQLGFSLILAPVLTLALGFVYPWLGFLANLVVVPLLPVLLIGLMVLMLWPQPMMLDWLNQGLLALSSAGGAWLSATLFQGSVSDPVLLGLLTVGLCLCLPRPLPRYGLAVLICCWSFLASTDSMTRLTVHDIGQGSAATLVSKGETVILDLAAGQEGGWSRMGEVLPSVADVQDVSLSISHADMDHIGGLHDALNALPIPHRIEGGGSLPGLLAPCVFRQVGEVTVMPIWTGEAPLLAEENHRSCVLLLRAANRHLLLMGDADWVAEAQVVRALHARGLLGRIDAVVVSHHGAQDGSNPSFVQLVGRPLALVSVGRGNRYAHPHRSVLDLWSLAGAEVLRTDSQGALTYTFATGQILSHRQQHPTRWNPAPTRLD